MTTAAALRDEFDLRRRHLLNALDELMSDQLHGRVGWQRRNELVDQIEQLIASADCELLHQLKDMGAKP